MRDRVARGGDLAHESGGLRRSARRERTSPSRIRGRAPPKPSRWSADWDVVEGEHHFARAERQRLREWCAVMAGLDLQHARRAKRVRDAFEEPDRERSPAAARAPGGLRGSTSAPRELLAHDRRHVDVEMDDLSAPSASISRTRPGSRGPAHSPVAIVRCSGRTPTITSPPTAPGRARRRARAKPAGAPDDDRGTAVTVVQPAGEEVHRRRADELGHEQVRRLGVEGLRRPTCCSTPSHHATRCAMVIASSGRG